MANILVITGSPRRGGNSDRMAEAFIRASETRGNSVERIDAAFLDVGGCMACNRCYSDGRPCIHSDAFTPIAEMIERADSIVLVTPVYWYTMPAMIKAVFDKFYALVVGGRMGIKRAALIACCEEHDPTVLDGVRVPFERSAALMKWEVVGEVLVPGVLNVGDIDGTDGCTQAASLAERFRGMTMGKRIVVLNGSPRRNGNTSRLVESFREGAESAGNTVDVFSLQDMGIHGCLGCFGGGKDPDHPCVQRDGMDLIYPAYKAADVVVLASPLYYWNLSGQLRTAFDRLFAVAECDPGYRNPVKECALLMSAEGDGFDEVVNYYDKLVPYLGWKDRGKVLCGGVMNVGDIDGHADLDEARELGASIRWRRFFSSTGAPRPRVAPTRRSVRSLTR